MTDDHGGHEGHHITPVSHLTATFLKLTVLMVLTIFAARSEFLAGLTQSDGGIIGANVLAMLIAFVKAGFVVMIFMGLKWASKLSRFFALLGVLGFAFFIFLVFDYGFRNQEPVSGWERVGTPSLQRDRERADDLFSSWKRSKNQVSHEDEAAGDGGH